MKKTLIFMAMVMVLLSSCSTKDIEQEANEQLKVTMREMANRPDDATLANVRTVYKSDSLCIIQFNFNGKNAIGMELSIPMEYIYAYVNNDGEQQKWETTTQLKHLFPVSLGMEDEEEKIAKALAEKGYDYEYLMEHKVEEIKEKYRKKLLERASFSEKDSNLDERLMYRAALLRFSASSREVPKEKGKDVKL